MFTFARGNEILEPNIAKSADPAATLSRQTRNRLLGLTFALCALSFALIGLLPGIFYTIVPQNDYLIFHIAFEFMSIVVSFAVFTVGWYGYKQNANKQDLVIGVTFLTVGIIDFAHTLSYNGMPAFLSPNSVSKAAMYWIAGRLVDSIGILAAAFVMAGSRRWVLRPACLLAGAFAFTVALIGTVSYAPDSLPAMYVPNQGLTPLKVGLEWIVIALYALAILVFGRRGHRETNVVLLQMALVIGIFSELSFTLYSSAYDTYNLLGHVYKVVAYFLIFRALFVSSLQRPYYQLLQTRNRLENSFARLGDALASGRESQQVLQLVAELARDMLGAMAAVVMLRREGELRIEAQAGLIPTSKLVIAEHSAAGMAMSSRRPVVIDDVDTIPGHGPDCHCQQIKDAPARSVVSAPILSETEALGAIQVYSSRIAAFGRKEADLLASFAHQASLAIGNSILSEREHQIAEMLQRSLLPDMPSIPGMDIDVRYLPAEDVARVGGDLYDAFALDDGNLAVLIGDVSGHGLEAASMMAMTAYTLRGLLLHGMPPGEAFDLTNKALVRRNSEEMRFATVFAAVLDTRNRTMTYANAGHMMPIVLQKGICASMEQRAELPMGIDPSVEYATYEADLSDITGILLYTDGLTEVRRDRQMFGEKGLTDACDELLQLPAAQLIEAVIGRAKEWSGGMLHDDVACLAIKWEGED